MATDTTPPPAVSRAYAGGEGNRRDARLAPLPRQKDEPMNTYTVPLCTNMNSADARAVWRSEVHAIIRAWHTDGMPRDAFTVDALDRVRSVLSAMRGLIDTGDTNERGLIDSVAGRVDEVVAHLSDADANRAADTAPDAVTVNLSDSLDAIADANGIDLTPVDPHAECTATAEKLRADLRNANAEITDASDYRLDALWTRVHEIADSRGYCSTFDEIADELGIPARMVSVTAVITATVFVEVSASELADDWRNAIAEAMDTDYLDWEVSSYDKD